MTSSTAPLFSGQSLGCIRSGRRVFGQLDFMLAPSQLLILTGPNGSGKSSLLRLMAGLADASEGMIAWDGSDIRRNRQSHAANLHYVGHATGVKTALTAAEDLAFWSSLRGFGQTEGCDRALARLGLADIRDVPTGLLSAGQQRRLALARLLTAPARLWLLDEPTVGLDDAGIESLLAALGTFCSDGGIAVIASHRPADLPDATGYLELADFAETVEAAT